MSVLLNLIDSTSLAALRNYCTEPLKVKRMKVVDLTQKGKGPLQGQILHNYDS